MITKPINVIVIDDQEADRELLSHYLKPHKDMLLVAQASTASEGISKIKNHSPHLVFLDIRLPDKDGFTMLDELSASLTNGFKVVFYSSSCEDYFRAIKYDAFDFLQKPLLKSDLDQTLEKFRRKLFAHSPATNNLSAENHLPAADTKKLVLTPKGYQCIDPSKLMFIHADKKHCELNFADGDPVDTCYTFKALLNHLNLPNLVKKHKSYAVNEAYVTGYSLDKKICYLASDQLKFEIPVARRKRKNLK